MSVRSIAFRCGQAVVAATVFLLPLQTRWIVHKGVLAGGTWEYGTLSLYATDALLFLAVVALWIALGKKFFRRPSFVPASVVMISVVVLLLLFFSLVNALDVGVGLGHAMMFVFGFVLWWTLLQSKISLRWLAIIVLASASIEAVVALVQVVNQFVSASTLFGMAAQDPATAGVAVVETAGGRFLRAYGTFSHPNIAAGWFVVAGILAAGLYIRAHDWLERIVIFALAVLIQAGLFVTFSRNGMIVLWLSMLTMLFATMVRDRKQRPHRFPFSLIHRTPQMWASGRMLRLTLASFFLLGIFAYVFQPLVSVRSGAVGRLETRSVTEREAQFSDARSVLGQHVVLGVGVGNYTKAVHDDVSSTRQSFDYQPVHFSLLLILAELGIVGWVGFLVIIELIAYISVHLHQESWKRSQPFGIPWSATTGLLLCAVLAMSFFEHYFWSLHIGVLLTWLCFSLWTIALSERHKGDLPKTLE